MQEPGARHAGTHAFAEGGVRAFLALWNDFDPGRDEEYNRWHTYEHVPERLSIRLSSTPGRVGCRRSSMEKMPISARSS